MSSFYDRHKVKMISRARVVADDIAGTCKDLPELASEAEQNDPVFCAELNEHFFNVKVVAGGTNEVRNLN